MKKKGGMTMFTFFAYLLAAVYLLGSIDTPSKAEQKRKKEQERKQLRYDIYKATRR